MRFAFALLAIAFALTSCVSASELQDAENRIALQLSDAGRETRREIRTLRDEIRTLEREVAALQRELAAETKSHNAKLWEACSVLLSYISNTSQPDLIVEWLIDGEHVNGWPGLPPGLEEPVAQPAYAWFGSICEAVDDGVSPTLWTEAPWR